MIKKRIESEKVEQIADKDSLLTMLASEEVLKEEWDNESDEKWNPVEA